MSIKTVINKSELHRAVVTFFHENQASIDTPRGIATWVRGEYNNVKEVLEELTAQGILEAHKVTSTTGYAYTRDTKVINEVKKALGA